MSNKCPWCGVGNTSAREVDSVRFKECDYCGSEFADMEDMLYNKETYKESVTMDKFIIIHEEVNYDRYEGCAYLSYRTDEYDFNHYYIESLIIDLLLSEIEDNAVVEDLITQNKQLIDERIRIKRCEDSKDPNLYTYDEYESIGVDYPNKDWDWVVLKKSFDNEGNKYIKNNVEYKDLVEALQIDNPVVKALMDKIKYENTLHRWIMQQEKDGVEVDRELLLKYNVYIPNKGEE